MQLPLFDLPPAVSRPTIADRRCAALQALVDAWLPDELEVEYRNRGWWLCGEPRWFGDDGRDFIGVDVEEAEWHIRELRRMAGKR